MEQVSQFVSNNLVLVGIWAALFAMLVYSYISTLFSSIKEVGTHELTQLVNKEDAIILDTRAVKEFKAGHILGARQIKEQDLKERNFAVLEKSKDKPIIVVCAFGNTARGVANAMAKAGFSQVSILKGGMSAWQNASLPVAK